MTVLDACRALIDAGEYPSGAKLEALTGLARKKAALIRDDLRERGLIEFTPRPPGPGKGHHEAPPREAAREDIPCSTPEGRAEIAERWVRVRCAKRAKFAGGETTPLTPEEMDRVLAPVECARTRNRPARTGG
jgi:hypothetical protein